MLSPARHREIVREAPADREALAGVEALERALLQVVGDRAELGQIRRADAAHQHAGRVERRGRERLALDDRRREPDAGHAWRCARPRPPSRSAAYSIGCTSRWPLRPRILSSSSLRKPFITDITMISVATPSMMPRKENPAMTEMNPSLAPRAQIAQRQHPFEGSEKAGSRWGRSSISVQFRHFTRFWRFQATHARGKSAPVNRFIARKSRDRVRGAEHRPAAVGAAFHLDLAVASPSGRPGSATECRSGPRSRISRPAARPCRGRASRRPWRSSSR